MTLPTAAAVLDRLAVASSEAALLALAVALVTTLGARWLTPRVRYALWLLVVARLLLPLPLPDPFGLRPPLRLFGAAPAVADLGEAAALPFGADALAGVARAPGADLPAAAGGAADRAPRSGRAEEPAWHDPSPAGGLAARWPSALLAGWAAVALGLLAFELARGRRFHHRLRRARPLVDRGQLALVAATARESGLRRPPVVRRTELVGSPAVVGVLRPRLLLPEHALARLDAAELRLVLRHELAHLRGRDLPLNALLLLLRCLHWFNPLLWLAFARLRAAQELARDWDALAREPAGAIERYAAALLKLLPGGRRDPSLPLAALLPRHSNLERRIVMILDFPRPRRAALALGALLAAGLGWAACTSAGGAPAAVSPRAADDIAADAIAWLLAQQTDAGYWDCDGAANGGSPVNDIGVTGLAMLALLAGDYDAAPHDAVERAARWLASMQRRGSGLFGDEVGNSTLYNHGIATLALGVVLDGGNCQDLRPTLELAVGQIERARNPYGGWRYALEPNGDNDTSVTVWMALALCSAREAGVEIDASALRDAKNWFDTMTDATGRCGYNLETGAGGRPVRPRRLQERYPPASSESLTAGALFARLCIADVLDEPHGAEHPRHELMAKQAGLLQACLPRWSEDGSSCDFHYWLMGTVAAKNWGGELLEPWQEAVTAALRDHQRLDAAAGALRGSWDPIGPWGEDGGRVYATALGALVLEFVSFSFPEPFGQR